VVLGANAFGVVKIAGDSPMSPRMIVLQNADKSDPLNQTITAGYKAFYAAKLLNAKRAVVIKSKSRFA
jgi:N4-gp56 family major capsid protein